MSDLVVRATLRDDILHRLAKIAAGVQAMEKMMSASQERMSQQARRHGQRTSTEIFKIDNAMRASARRMVARAALIGGALAAVAGHAVALTAAIWPLVGALGALPAVTFGGVAGIVALAAGLSGLGAAMKKTAGGSSSAADQIASAQRRLELANRSLRDSQEALNDAWETARDRLRDIQTQYAGAQLDVEAAALAVRDAELALREARSSGDRQERLRADLALRQARLSQIEAVNRLSDVEQEYNERLAKGVEGSDEVRDATERHADALYELAQAQKALTQAQTGGGGEDAYSKLSASARKLVDTLRAIGPAWRQQVQQATQERLFAGVAEDARLLSDRYLPVMQRQLPDIAQGWNSVFRSISGVASRADRVRDVDESLGLMAVMWQRVGTSFGRFFDGFLDWVRVGSDFLPRLGRWVDDHAAKWARWSAEVRNTGRAHRWIENSLITGHKFNELIKSWGRSLFEVFRLGQDPLLLDRLVEGSRAFERWLSTAQGQERITRMWERAREVGSALWMVVKEAMDLLSQLDVSSIAAVMRIFADVLGFAADNMGLLNSYIGPIVAAMLTLTVATKAATVAQNLYNASFGRWRTLGKEGAAGYSRVGIAAGALGSYLMSVALAGTTVATVFGRDLNPKTDALAASFERFARTGQASGEMARLFGDDLKGLGDALKVANVPGWLRGWVRSVDQFTGVGAKFNWTVSNMEERIGAADDALAAMVRSGNVDEAEAAFRRMLEVTGNAGAPVEKLKQLFPEYFAAIEAGQGTQNELVGSTGLLAKNFQAALDNAQDFYGFLHSQTNPLFRYADAKRAYAQAQEAVNEAERIYGRNSPQYRDAVLKAAEANLALDAAASEAANSLTSEMIDAMDLSAEEARVLREELGGANADLDRLDGRRASIELEVKGIRGLQNAIIGSVTNAFSSLQLSLGALKFHEGGVVPGRRGQEVAAVLQAGEGVLSLRQMDALQQGRGGPGVPANVHVTVDVTGGDSELSRWLKKRIRVEGAGSFGLQPA